LPKRISTAVFIIAGAVCAVYGTAVSGLGSGSGFFIVWYVLAAAAFALAACIASGLWRRLPKALRVIVIIVIVLGIAVVGVSWGFILGDFNSSGEANLDYIIVLGAQVGPSGPSVVLRYRLEAALEYLQSNPDTLCITSGGQGANEPEAEGEVMRRWLLNRGISPGRVAAEIQSTNTIENLNLSAALLTELAGGFDMEKDSVGIVTNNFHVFRALKLARACGFKNVCGIAADSSRGYLLHNMLRETVGLLKEIVMGNV
jgi:uncharacterized SAM-binding protein YcdF (DUF218 family)